MKESIQLVLYETVSLPRAYKALEELSESGLEPLEFYPHASGVRILLKAPPFYTKALPEGATSVTVSVGILKAILSQTENKLRKLLAVVETESFLELLKLVVNLEKNKIDILEVRSLRSNPRKNYALITMDDKASAETLLSEFDHSFLSASSKVLKEFLGFN